jgi:putative peptide zinc metalloprotease protein
MAEHGQTFSESWYRVSPLKVALRQDVRIQRQLFRGKPWFVIENPMTNQFFRVRPAAHEFIARLDGRRAVGDIWEELLDTRGEDAPGQGEVIQLLSQLYNWNLLSYGVGTDAARLFERARKREGRELRSRLFNILFLRFPLVDPDRFLQRLLPYLGWLVGPAGVLMASVAAVAACLLMTAHWERLMAESGNVLAPDNLLLLYAGLVFSKGVHELGHGLFCRKFGGEVHAAGIMLMIFSPVPYVDATSSWAFRERHQRLAVAAAGMLVELLLAALALALWSNTGQGWLHRFCYNIIFISSVSTVLFNINPLLRFDGYYILTDLIGMPNLQSRSMSQLQYLVKRWVFGVRALPAVADSAGEGAFLAAFGLLSLGYRVFLFGGIALFIAGQFPVVGLFVALACLAGWLLFPLGKGINYLVTSTELQRTRGRALGLTALLAAAVGWALYGTPVPVKFSAPGVVKSTQRPEVVTGGHGEIERLHAGSGALVKAGDPLVELRNPELRMQLRFVEAQMEQGRAQLAKALVEDPANVDSLRQKIAALGESAERLRAEERDLVCRAPLGGTFHAPTLERGVGRWVGRGEPVGMILGGARHEFYAVVRQEDAGRLFGGEGARARVRLAGQERDSLAVESWVVLPAGAEELPSQALGWIGGGSVQVSSGDQTGLRTQEPYYLVKATLAPTPVAAALHGRTGRLQLEVGRRPLLRQALDAAFKLFQRRTTL